MPTDCLAAHLAKQLPDATRLELAFQTIGGLSRGTAATVARDLHHSGFRRHDGELVPQRAAAQRRRVDFGQGPVTVATNPWRADLVTAAHSTGIPTIDTYTALPGPLRGLMRLAPTVPALFGSRPWRAAMNATEKESNEYRDTFAIAPSGTHDSRTDRWCDARDSCRSSARGRRIGRPCGIPRLGGWMVLGCFGFLHRPCAKSQDGVRHPGLRIPAHSRDHLLPGKAWAWRLSDGGRE